MLFGNQFRNFVVRVGARTMVTASVITMSLVVAGCGGDDKSTDTDSSSSSSVGDPSMAGVPGGDQFASGPGAGPAQMAGDPNSFDGDPNNFGGDPNNFDGAPGAADGIDPGSYGDPNNVDGDPSNFNDGGAQGISAPVADVGSYDGNGPGGAPGDPALGAPGDAAFAAPDAALPDEANYGGGGDPNALPGDPALAGGGIPNEGDFGNGAPGAPPSDPALGGAGIPNEATYGNGAPGAPPGAPGDPAGAGVGGPAQLPAPNFDGGAGVGAAGGPGVGNVAGPGPNRGNGGATAPPATSPLYPAYHVALALNKGEVKGLSKYISTRARGTLASLRSGQVTAKQAADYKAAFAKPTSPNMKTKSGETTITMRSGDYFITMRVKKEGRAFVLTSLSHRKSSRKSKR